MRNGVRMRNRGALIKMTKKRLEDASEREREGKKKFERTKKDLERSMTRRRRRDVLWSI